MEYKILYKDGRAKRAEMKTVHGIIQTPVFMNVGTVAAIKGAVYIMRKALNGMKSEDAVEQILNMFTRTKNNAEFVQTVKKQKFI